MSNRPFGQVETAAQDLVKIWTTILELMSTTKRLQAFQTTLHDKPLTAIEREVMLGKRGSVQAILVIGETASVYCTLVI